MTGIVERLRNTPTERTWDSVGRPYDYPKHLPIEAADEIERLTLELSRRRKEEAAAVMFLRKMTELVPIRDVVKATATVGTLIDYYAAAIRKAEEPTP